MADHLQSHAAFQMARPLTGVLGRAQEIEAVRQLLVVENLPLVTLTGPGGVGKTRLAQEIGFTTGADYADGALFVDLSPVQSAGQVLDAIARSLGVHANAGRSVFSALTAFLRRQQMLLVLDNFEHVLDAAPEVAVLLGECPALQMLVTSRAPLRVRGERVFLVEPLPVPQSAPAYELDALARVPAVALLIERSREVNAVVSLTESNAASLAGICQKLDGLPLAIELAAPRLRVLAPDALLALLDNRLRAVSAGPRDVPARHRSLHAAIAWSYELLNPQEQAVFRGLSVFVGGFDVESAAATLDIDIATMARQIEVLHEQSLLQRRAQDGTGIRFGMLETVREFAAEALRSHGDEHQMRANHAHYFLEFACSGAPRSDEPVRVAWIRRLSTEHLDLLAAFDFLCVPETGEESLRFAAAMGPYWHTRGPFSEWQPRLSRAFELASSEPTILKVHVLFWMSLILGASPDFPAAMRAANRCLEMADQVGTTSDRAAAIQILAWVHDCHQQWEIARELREEAISLWISVGNTYMHAMCLVLNAGIAYACGDLDRAQREAAQAGAMFEALGDVDWGASAVWYQGLLAVVDGRLDLGAARYEQSLRTGMQGESRSRWYRPLVGLADIAAAIGHCAAAARLLGAADKMLIVGGRELTLFDKPGYERAETRCREALGSAAFETERLAGSWLTPDAWLVEAREITEAARTRGSGPSTRSRRHVGAESFGLTARERDVLCLMARRLTDAEIADQLFIGYRTVTTHVTRVIDKLGARNRRDAAAIAARHGLIEMCE